MYQTHCTLIQATEFYTNFITFFDISEANTAGTFQNFISLNNSD